MKLIKYGIRRIGDYLPVTMTICSEEGDFTVSVSYHLDCKHYEEELIWYCEDKEHALDVLNNPRPRYNAAQATPTHSLDPKLYEVVKIEISITKEN